jgi:uncharacterized protein YqeY
MLKKKIETDFWQALKEKNILKYSALRMVRADIINKEKEKRYRLSTENRDFTERELEEKSCLTDEEILEVISSKIKRSRESIPSFEKGEREDLVKKEKEEIEILKDYLPEQLSEKEIKKMVEETVKKVKAEGIKDMGKVMSELMPNTKGKADGALVSRIVKEMIS